LVWFVQRHVLMLLHEWIWLNQHEHEESNQFFFWEKNYILAHDLKFLEFEFKLSHDVFGIAYQLHRDLLCKVWERFLLIWSSLGRFSFYPVSLLFWLPHLFIARQSRAVAGASRTTIQRGSAAAIIPSPTFMVRVPMIQPKNDWFLILC